MARTEVTVALPPGSNHGKAYDIKHRCPCCASNRVKLNEFVDYNYAQTEPKYQYNIVCTQCGIQTSKHKTPEEAILVWDRREI